LALNFYLGNGNAIAAPLRFTRPVIAGYPGFLLSHAQPSRVTQSRAMLMAIRRASSAVSTLTCESPGR
jgi:hypothetical protein